MTRGGSGTTTTTTTATTGTGGSGTTTSADTTGREVSSSPSELSLPDTPTIVVKHQDSAGKMRHLGKQLSFTRPNLRCDADDALKHLGISKRQMREFRAAFNLFDKSGEGNITMDDLGRVMRSFGQFARGEELEEMLKEVDSDGDGYVSFEEFVGILINIGAAQESDADQEERELKDAFRVFDKHNRGYIIASDLRAVLQCLGEDLDEEEIEDMIKEVDVDGDGRIDFYEFVHALGEPEDQEGDEEEAN